MASGAHTSLCYLDTYVLAVLREKHSYIFGKSLQTTTEKYMKVKKRLLARLQQSSKRLNTGKEGRKGSVFSLTAATNPIWMGTS